jgi:hypothetical protein
MYHCASGCAMTNVAKAVLVVLGNAIVALIVGLVLSGISSSGVISIELTHTLFIVAFVLAVIGVVATSMLSSMRIGYIAIIGMCSLIIVGGMLLWLNSWLQVKKEQQDALSKPPILNTNPGPPHIPISMFPRRTEQSSKASVGNQTKIHGNDNVVVGSLNTARNKQYRSNRRRREHGDHQSRDKPEPSRDRLRLWWLEV